MLVVNNMIFQYFNMNVHSLRSFSIQLSISCYVVTLIYLQKYQEQLLDKSEKQLANIQEMVRASPPTCHLLHFASSCPLLRLPSSSILHAPDSLSPSQFSLLCFWIVSLPVHILMLFFSSSLLLVFASSSYSIPPFYPSPTLQVDSIEFAAMEQKIFAGLKEGNEVLKAIHKEMSIEAVEDLMADTQDAIDYQNVRDLYLLLFFLCSSLRLFFLLLPHPSSASSHKIRA